MFYQFRTLHTQWTLIVKIKFSQQHFLYMFSWSPGWWTIGFNFLETMQTKISIILSHICSSIIRIYPLVSFRYYNEIQKEAKLSRILFLSINEICNRWRGGSDLTKMFFRQNHKSWHPVHLCVLKDVRKVCCCPSGRWIFGREMNVSGSYSLIKVEGYLCPPIQFQINHYEAWSYDLLGYNSSG